MFISFQGNTLSFQTFSLSGVKLKTLQETLDETEKDPSLNSLGVIWYIYNLD